MEDKEMLLNRETWENFCYKLSHPNEKLLKARDNFLAEHRELNIEKIIACLENDQIKE